ncbi:hypothetical protein FIBSPDRAFT_1051039 [Athelia psychrophila]|uniref:Uncharacterized protein n=1 Tax=Athelia psychrophila TaxID=1759441 RepID=A0A165ZTV8_9AGAM|nr:hypothetical protein FIBSPDRAFT_1051039 [Fibularhizoctonia sp. CBS 109695]
MSDNGSQNRAPISQHNDGKGIRVSLTFTHLPTRIKKGQKMRKNAKPKVHVDQRVMYIHEDVDLAGLAEAAVDAVGQYGKLNYTIANRSGALDPLNFSIEYTIPRREKDIPLVYPEDLEALMDEVVVMKKPTFKLSIAQFKPEDEDSESEDDESEEENDRQKKKQKTGPSAEEIAQNVIIADLTAKYGCEDRACPFSPCWLSLPEGKHVHLTNTHLNTWAAAMAAGIAGIDDEHPPTGKISRQGLETGAACETAPLARMWLMTQ